MNFAQAVKGRKCVSVSIQAIQDQAELELRRTLNRAELAALTKDRSPVEFEGNIHKVLFFQVKMFLYMMNFSMDMVF